MGNGNNSGFLPGAILGALLVSMLSSKDKTHEKIIEHHHHLTEKEIVPMSVEYLSPAKMQAPHLPSLPPHMAVGLPSAYVTPINMGDGMIKRFFEKKRTKDVYEMVSYQRQASDNMLAIARNNAEAMKIHMTFASEVQMVFLRHDHEKEMMKFEAEKAKKDIELMDFSGQKMQLENQILYHQATEAEISAKIAQLDFEARKQAMGVA